VSEAVDLTFLDVGTCPVCGSTALKPWRRAFRDRSGTVQRRFSYVTCTRCGAAVLADPPSPESLGAFYPDDYSPYVRASSAVLALFAPEPSADRLTRALQPLYALPRPGAHMLDFGCGSAATVDAARESGWQTTGVDFTESVVARVRDAGHEAFRVDEAWDVAGRYDLIRSTHVIEHVYDPVPVLQRLVRSLAPGGALHLATPNPRGVGSRLFRGHWFGLEPRHIALFPPSLLARLAREAGAEDVRIVHETVTKDMARSGVSLASDLGLHRGGLRHPDGPKAANQVARPLAILATKAGLSDRYHLLARAPR
jgi:2-polyprenyl-3-methyl-5-hydroxy-6-metoxy-1,4-benzoquinol methylase